MSIQDLGSIGELVAAIATIFTLLYLALQIRLSAKSSSAEAERQIIRDYNLHFETFFGSRESTRIMVNGLKHGLASLSKEEAMMFSARMSELLQNYRSVVLMSRKGLVDEEIRESMRTTIAMFIATSGGQEWWKFTSFAFNFPEVMEDLTKYDGPSFEEWHDRLIERSKDEV